MKKFNHIFLPELNLERVVTDTGRLYKTPNGVLYPSVTTITSIMNKDAIDKWKEKVGIEEATRIGNIATVRGTALHELVEYQLKNTPKEIIWHTNPILHEMFNSIKQSLSYIDNIRAIEQMMYSERIRSAGTVDCIADFNGKLSIIDFKTANKPKKVEWIEHYFVQTMFYAIMLFELYNLKVEQLVLLIVNSKEMKTQVFISYPTKEMYKLVLQVRQKYDNTIKTNQNI